MSAPPPAAGEARGLIANPEALLQAELDRQLLAASGHSADELARIAELQALPALSDDELARQAESAPGADGDPATPE